MLRITRSLLHHSRCSARRRGRGAAGGLLSIPMLSRRLTVAPFLHPALSASSAVLPIASSHQHYFLFSLSGNATVFDQDDAAGLMPSTATDECTLRCSHPRGLSIPAPGSSDLPSSLPSSHLLFLPLSGARLRRKAAHACSDCACLPALPDKLRLYTTVVGPLTSESTASTLLLLRCCSAAPPY